MRSDRDPPGVFRDHQERLGERKIGRRSFEQLPCAEPFLAEPEGFAEAGHFPRIRATAVDPRVPDFLIDDRQRMGIQAGGIIIHAAKGDSRVGIGRARLGQPRPHVGERGHFHVVADHAERKHRVIAGEPVRRPVAPAINHNHLGEGLRIAPAEHLGHVGNRRHVVHPDMQKFHARAGEQWDDPPRVAGHIGHLRGNRFPAEARIESLRKR